MHKVYCLFNSLVTYANTVHRDVEIFLDVPVIWTDFENLVSPNNTICSRDINFFDSPNKFCQSIHYWTSLL